MIDLIATDFEVRILPDEFTKGGTLLGLVLAWFVPLNPEITGLIFYFAKLQASPQDDVAGGNRPSRRSSYRAWCG
ncbi:MAG: hypothetical protein WDO18_12415 [Acidobacteriota bacterium]